jgi:hypothetical protein
MLAGVDPADGRIGDGPAEAPQDGSALQQGHSMAAISQAQSARDPGQSAPDHHRLWPI